MWLILFIIANKLIANIYIAESGTDSQGMGALYTGSLCHLPVSLVLYGINNLNPCSIYS